LRCQLLQIATGHKACCSIRLLSANVMYQGYVQGDIVLPEGDPHRLPQPRIAPAVTTSAA